MFQPNSRYYLLETAAWTDAEGRVVRYVCRRIIARTPVTPLAEHRVVAGDRLDNVTARYLGDAEQFWRVCDANLAERPSDPTAAVGRLLVIPMPALR